MLFVFALLTLLELAVAFPSRLAALPSPRLLKRQQSGKVYPNHTIDQLIDHFPNSARYEPHPNGTFKQRYVFDTTYYKPGGPVLLYIGGETDLESRFENLETGIIQILMKATNGLGVILENRFYGGSIPFATLTTDQLAFLTTEQTIADIAYFAQHASFPGVSGNLTADNVPYILYGGSLAGAQTAFAVKTYGDLLWGGIASSGVVHAVLGYPQWYAPIQKWAPSDCTGSINAIIDKVDQVIASGDKSAIQQMKEVFGLGALTDLRDFAMTIAFPLGGPFDYPTNTWQELNWDPAQGADDFWLFCENVTNIEPPVSISSVDTMLSNYTNGEAWTNLGNYANYVKQNIVPLCESGDINSAACFGTQHPAFYADTSINANGNRQYLYQTCTELGAYQVAPPSGPSLISRQLQVNYTQQWCDWAFAPGKYNKIPSTPDLDQFNKYGNLNISAPRLAFIDGNEDVWLDVCYHSNFAPERYQTSDLHPELLLATGGHHWDSYGIGNVAAEPQFIQQAHLWEIRTVKKWLEMWKTSHSTSHKEL